MDEQLTKSERRAILRAQTDCYVTGRASSISTVDKLLSVIVRMTAMLDEARTEQATNANNPTEL